MDVNRGLARRRIRLRDLGVVVTVAILAAVWLAWQAGAITPRLAPGSGSEYGADPGTIYYRFSIRNDSLVPVTIVGAGRGGAGLELTSVDGQFPISLGRGEETWIRLDYRVTDCDAVTEDPWPIPLTVLRLWGRQTVHLPLPTQDQSQWTGSDLPPLGVTRNGPVQWQRSQTDLACALQDRGR